MDEKELSGWKKKFRTQRDDAISRGIEFKLTFEEWFDWWKATGKMHLRGPRKGQFVMARFGDKGAYESANIYCATTEQNHAEAILQMQRGSEHHKAKLTEEQARQIKYGEPGRLVDIAPKYGVSTHTIADIKNGKTWRHI